jgi:hypothetical protein
MYYNKYLKYKTKYLNAGGGISDIIGHVTSMFGEKKISGKEVSNIIEENYILMLDAFIIKLGEQIPDLTQETLHEIKEMLIKYKELIIKFFNSITYTSELYKPFGSSSGYGVYYLDLYSNDIRIPKICYPRYTGTVTKLELSICEYEQIDNYNNILSKIINLNSYALSIIRELEKHISGFVFILNKFLTHITDPTSKSLDINYYITQIKN